MTRKLEPILADILDRIGKIQAATQDKTFEDFEADWILRFAVERGIENISEAVRHIPEETLDQQPQIPWPLVKGIGNILRHEYHRIAPKVIWTVVTQHLEPLRIAANLMQQSLSKTNASKKTRKRS
jgi:uncharacterized protein with HEPN domain